MHGFSVHAPHAHARGRRVLLDPPALPRVLLSLLPDPPCGSDTLSLFLSCSRSRSLSLPLSLSPFLSLLVIQTRSLPLAVSRSFRASLRRLPTPTLPTRAAASVSKTPPPSRPTPSSLALHLTAFDRMTHGRPQRPRALASPFHSPALTQHSPSPLTLLSLSFAWCGATRLRPPSPLSIPTRSLLLSTRSLSLSPPLPSPPSQIVRYNVIPLSPVSGLIEWVPDCDTLHGLIRDYRESRKVAYVYIYNFTPFTYTYIFI